MDSMFLKPKTDSEMQNFCASHLCIWNNWLIQYYGFDINSLEVHDITVKLSAITKYNLIVDHMVKIKIQNKIEYLI